MGQDLAKKATPTFRKLWDRERRNIKQGDLLTLIPEQPQQVLEAELYDDVKIIEGDKVHVRCAVDGIWIDRDLMKVGAATSPSRDLLRRMEAGQTMFDGKVVAVHAEAGIIEIVIA